MRGHRIKVALDDELYEIVAEVARRRGCSMAQVARDAIDLRHFSDTEAGEAAFRRLLADDVLFERETPLRW